MREFPRKPTPIILDAYCGSGGVARGLARAGWTVVGVDNDPARLREYPYAHYLGDALEFIYNHGHQFTAIWASPDCRGYSRGTAALPDRLDRYDRQIAAARDVLLETGKPYVIENVADARRELQDPALLCGRMWGLGATDDDGTDLVLDGHRLFETNWGFRPPVHEPHADIGCACPQCGGSRMVAGVYGGARRDKYQARHVRRGGYVPPNPDVLADLLGIERGTMSEDSLYKAIPPVYSEFIGAQLLRHVEAEWAADQAELGFTHAQA